jgi:hypothetical protein
LYMLHEIESFLLNAMDKENIKTNSNNEKIPECLFPFFWDVGVSMLTIKGSSYFIISRLLETGDEKAVKFLLSTFSKNELIYVLKKSRSISKRSRNFWRIFFDQENEPCTPKRYPTPFGDCL